MLVLDSNKNGFIDYTEFIAACLQSYNYLKESHLKAAFSFFDKDSSGSISLEELKMCLQNEDYTLDDDSLNKLMTEVDADHNGQIDYSEFIAMMKSNSEFKSLISIAE
jgi:calcium-dependent protein kinase